MKKFITVAVLASVLLVNSAFANKTNTADYPAESTFKKEFSQAKDVSWHKSDNLYKAFFKLNDEYMTAYFNLDGEFLGVVHNILSTQLPINLQASLKKAYDGYWISDLFELAKPDSSSYFITIQNADQTITLESTNSSNWSVYSKTKKS
jgi:hypothetical protein